MPDPKLLRLNERIAALAGLKPGTDLYVVFFRAARLAAEAIRVAEEHEQFPGANVQALQPALEFWRCVRDSNDAAALAVVGGNQSLAQALVTFRFMQNMK